MKRKTLLFIGILVSFIGYAQEIQIKTIDNKSVPIAFVKVSSGGICLGFTNESGILILDNESILGKKILLKKSIYHSKEVKIEDIKEIFIFDLEKLDESALPDYSIEEVYSLIQQVLHTSKKNSPNKKLEGFVCFSLESSLNLKPVVKNDIKIQFWEKPTKIKILGKIENPIKVWLKSALKAEPVRNRIYKSLYKNSDYTYSVESSYSNELDEIILVINIINKNNELNHTQLVIDYSNKKILEFHNSWQDRNQNGISEPDYHAIYSQRNGLLYTDYLSATYIYQKNGETDTRNIQVFF